jgi:hypothetical protein
VIALDKFLKGYNTVTSADIIAVDLVAVLSRGGSQHYRPPNPVLAGTDELSQSPPNKKTQCAAALRIVSGFVTCRQDAGSKNTQRHFGVYSLGSPQPEPTISKLRTFTDMVVRRERSPLQRLRVLVRADQPGDPRDGSDSRNATEIDRDSCKGSTRGQNFRTVEFVDSDGEGSVVAKSSLSVVSRLLLWLVRRRTLRLPLGLPSRIAGPSAQQRRAKSAKRGFKGRLCLKSSTDRNRTPQN